MKCKSCGYMGHPERRVVLTIKVLTDDEGRVLKRHIVNKVMPFGNLREWVADEAETQEVSLFCPKCGVQAIIKSRRKKNED